MNLHPNQRMNVCDNDYSADWSARGQASATAADDADAQADGDLLV
jgi:hypothetical protein